MTGRGLIKYVVKQADVNKDFLGCNYYTLLMADILEIQQNMQFIYFKKILVDCLFVFYTDKISTKKQTLDQIN